MRCSVPSIRRWPPSQTAANTIWPRYRFASPHLRAPAFGINALELFSLRHGSIAGNVQMCQP
jgi:hypothetical protein